MSLQDEPAAPVVRIDLLLSGGGYRAALGATLAVGIFEVCPVVVVWT